MEWYNSEWIYRKKVTIPASEVSSSLTGFATYLDLSTLGADFHTNVKSDGSDIRVTTDDGSTEIPLEVVSIDTTAGTGELHFRGDLSSSSDTVFYVYYGNSSATAYAAVDTYGREAVWADYNMVHHLQDENQTPIGEIFRADRTSTIDEGVTGTKTFSGTYTDPVVVAYINTFNGSQAVGIRVKDVTSTGCKIFMQEPDNQGHTAEIIYVLVMEAGVHTLPGGALVEAGHQTTGVYHTTGTAYSTSSEVTFSASFSSTPAVLHTLNTHNNNTFMASACHGVNSSRAYLLQEAAGSGNTATTEDIGWIAIETGFYDWFEVGVGSDGNCGVDDGGATLNLSKTFTNSGNLIVSQNTGSGLDGGWARGGGTNVFGAGQSSFLVYCEEDQVNDIEQTHTTESFGWIAFDTQSSELYSRGDMLKDSTSNNNNAMPHSSFTGFAAGKIGESLDLDGSFSHAILEASSTIQPTTFPIIISGWIKPDSFSVQDGIYTSSRWDNSIYAGLHVKVGSADVIGISFGVGNAGGGPGARRSHAGSTSLTAGAWHHFLIAATDIDTVDIFLDGSPEIITSSGTGTTLGNYADIIPRIGTKYDDDFFDGDIDELRIRTSSMSYASWAAAEHKNHDDPSNFYSIADQESLGIKVYDGTSWAFKPVKYYDGSQWVVKPVKRYNGSSWG